VVRMFTSDSGFSRCTLCSTLVAFLAVRFLCRLPDVLGLSGGEAAFELYAYTERIRSPALDFYCAVHFTPVGRCCFPANLSMNRRTIKIIAELEILSIGDFALESISCRGSFELW
jgi:hypothetical protein